MTNVLIAAVAPSDAEIELEKVLLQCVGMEAGRLTLFVRDISREGSACSRLHFIPFRGSPTNVPGVCSTLALSAYLVDGDLDYLKGIGISSDAAKYYNMAIDEGRSVVTYMASPENAARVEGQLCACGFGQIRRFPIN
jgi:hypothetical protein